MATLVGMPASNAHLPNPSACPLCGSPNQCAMEVAKATGQAPGVCWCAGMDFSAELLAQVPTEAQRLACICERCARLAQTQASHG